MDINAITQCKKYDYNCWCLIKSNNADILQEDTHIDTSQAMRYD